MAAMWVMLFIAVGIQLGLLLLILNEMREMRMQELREIEQRQQLLREFMERRPL